MARFPELRAYCLSTEQHPMEIPNSGDVHLTLRDVAVALRAAADSVDRIATTLSDIDQGSEQPRSPGSLVIDPEGLTVSWNGATCYLGFTIPFRLLERLARRPGQYVTHDQLLQEIWGGPRSKSAIRSAMNVLRSRLTSAGMSDLADAIDGRNAGRYGLVLDGSHWASHKSIKPIEPDDEDDETGSGRDVPADWRGKARRNATHRSTTDPEARLARKGAGKEAHLCHSAHVVMETRRGLLQIHQ